MLDTLRRFLPMADKVVPRRTSLKVLENICIDDGAVRATDLEISIGMKIDSDASCLIPLAIAKVIMKSKPPTLSCQPISDDRLRIDYGNRSIEFTPMPIEDYPMPVHDDFIDIGTWNKAAVLTMHSLTAFCSEDELRPAMTGVYLHQDDDVMTLAATDGHVLKKATLHGDFKPITAILPKRALQILSRIVKRQVQASISDTHLRLVIDHDIELVVKTIDGTFPDIDKVIPTTTKHEVIVDKTKILNLLIDAKAFADKKMKRAMLLFHKTKMDIEVDNVERGMVWRTSIIFDGKMSDDFKIAVNIDYLDKVFRDVIEDRVLWRFNDAGEAMLLHGVGVQREVILLMPIRIKEDHSEEHRH
jgi:DNA polymerase III subunit beta